MLAFDKRRRLRSKLRECRQIIKNHIYHAHWLAIQPARDVIDAVRKLSEFLKREPDSATEGDLQNYLLLGAIPFCASQSQRVGPAGLAGKPERSAAQGMRDSEKTQACGIRIPQACPVDRCALWLQGKAVRV